MTSGLYIDCKTNGTGYASYASRDRTSGSVIWLGGSDQSFHSRFHKLSELSFGATGFIDPEFIDQKSKEFFLGDSSDKGAGLVIANVSIKKTIIVVEVYGTRFSLFREGEWLICEPRSNIRPELRGHEGLWFDARGMTECVKLSARIPVKDWSSVVLTDIRSDNPMHKELFSCGKSTTENIENVIRNISINIDFAIMSIKPAEHI